jgi:phage tail P2-like protein
MPTILPGNATRTERSLEAASGDRVERMPVPVGDLWDPDACPEAALPWLAWALSVDRWDPDWPLDAKRAVVADSVRHHRVKGTLAAVRRALEDVGAIYDVEENPGGAAFTLQVDIFNSGSLLTGAIPRVREQIEDSKRLSVHVSIAATAGFEARAAVAAGAALVQVAPFSAVLEAA